MEHSAAPVAVRASLENLLDGAPAVVEQIASTPTLAEPTIAVMAASRSLTRTIEADPPTALAVLADLDRRPPMDDRSPDGLVAWRNREFLRIAARDLIGLDDLEAVGAHLADLGNQVLDSSCARASCATTSPPWTRSSPAAAGASRSSASSTRVRIRG